MTRLFYNAQHSESFPFNAYIGMEKIPYDLLTKTFPRSTWFGESQLKWESLEREGSELVSVHAIDHLVKDTSSRLILYCGSEIVGIEGLQHYIDLVLSWGIQPCQLHYILCSVPQAEAARAYNPNIKVSVFHQWEMYCAAKTQRWTNSFEPQKHWLYLNRRSSPERLTLAYYLLNQPDFVASADYSLHPAIYWSNLTKTEELEHHRRVLEGVPDQIRKGIKRWIMTNPWRTIAAPEQRDPYRYHLFESHTEQLFKGAAISLVTESHPYHQYNEYMPTEKIFRPIAAGRPFLVLGTQNYLKNLQQQGYQTFGNIWDESYDTEQDLWLRLEQLRDTVLAVNTRQLKDIIAETTAITKHNQQQLMYNTEPQRVRTLLHKELQDLVQFQGRPTPKTA